jgi:hypothetical protein
VNSSL